MTTSGRRSIQNSLPCSDSKRGAGGPCRVILPAAGKSPLALKLQDNRNDRIALVIKLIRLNFCLRPKRSTSRSKRRYRIPPGEAYSCRSYARCWVMQSERMALITI